MMLTSIFRAYRPILRRSGCSVFNKNTERNIAVSLFKFSDDGDNNKNTTVSKSNKNDLMRSKQSAEDREEEPSFSLDEMIMNSTKSTESFDVIGRTEEGYDDEYMDDDDISSQILNVALEYVPTYGWSDKAIEEAIESLELSKSSKGMFKRGSVDLVIHFIEKCNIELADILAAESKRNSSDKLSDDEMREFLEKAIQTRLQMIIPYIDKWAQAMAILASPLAAADCFEHGANMIDEIWYHAGDMTTDISWYTKRGGLAATYLATEVFMLQDKSTNFVDTWEFLHRRMNDLSSAEAMKESLNHAVSDITNLANAGVITAQNILGLNNRNR